eukprot:3933908-Pleurochrysis_carterae.AAC.2
MPRAFRPLEACRCDGATTRTRLRTSSFAAAGLLQALLSVWSSEHGQEACLQGRVLDAVAPSASRAGPCC